MEPQIKIRFNNPQYDSTTKKFKLDVEFQSDQENQKIFGINVRFFYDATIFLPSTPTSHKVSFIEFAPGYSIQNKSSIATSTTLGKTWFNLATGPVTYVNWAIQTSSVNSSPVISTSNWTKLFAIEVISKNVLTGSVCPSFIWDKKNKDQGYMINTEGVTLITVVDPTGDVTNQSAIELPSHFNWSPTPGKTSAPWGNPHTSNCINV